MNNFQRLAQNPNTAMPISRRASRKQKLGVIPENQVKPFSDLSAENPGRKLLNRYLRKRRRAKVALCM